MNTSKANTGEQLLVHDRLIPLSKVQAMVGISRSQIYRLLDEGTLPRPAKVGRRIFFSELELQSWVREKLELREGAKS